MKLLLPVIVTVCAVVSVNADKEMHAMKKWAFMKAIESCFGPENVKLHMVHIKKAVAKCSGMEAPQLGLPMFKNPHRAVGALVHSAFNPVHGDGTAHHHHAHTHDSGSHDHDNEDDYLEKMFKRMIYKKMVAKIMAEDFLGEEEDDDDMGMAFTGAGLNSGLKKNFRRRAQQYRYV